MNDAMPAPAAAPAGEVRAAAIRPEFVREGPSLFWLALGQACLTILTLGIYRFWMVTRLRRHYWSGIRLMGDPFEYTGTGLEKLTGFLVAVIILAVYLSIVNVGFVFAGLVSTDDVVGLELAVNLSVLASLPLIYFATYRAKRYMMARTRWRGIRFGMEQGAWGYAGRAVALTLLSSLTLGLLYPYQNFVLARYATDRTWFGDLKFEQGGRWTRLMGYWAWVYVGVALVGAAFAVVIVRPRDPEAAGVAAMVLMAGYFAIYLAVLRYRVAAFRFFWDNRTLAGARFRNRVDTGEIIGVSIFGSMGVWTAAAVAAALAMVIAATVWAAVIGPERFAELLGRIEAGQTGSAVTWPVLAMLAIGYLSAVPAAIAFTQVWMTRPILTRQVGAMRIANADALAAARQRGHDHALEAGGFADALGVDIGSGF